VILDLTRIELESEASLRTPQRKQKLPYHHIWSFFQRYNFSSSHQKLD